MAKLYSLSSVRPLSGDGKTGIGRVGKISKTTVRELAEFTQKIFSFPALIVSGDDKGPVSTVALLNGGGADEEYIDAAISKGATCLITSEIKHHIAIYALTKGISLICSSHFATERFYIPILAETLKKEIKNVKVLTAKEQNPFVPVQK